MISVIIPTYNSAEYIIQALESVFAQTYNNYEVIVVNDGSTDNTYDVIAGYFDRIIYLEQVNTGPAAARNLAIRHANGEYLAFLDSDDTWLPEKLARQVEIFDQYSDTALVYTCMREFTNSQMELGSVYPVEVPSGHIFDDILHGILFLLSSVLVRTNIVRKFGGFDETLITAEDTNLWLKIAHTYSIIGLSDVLVLRRKHTNNISNNISVNVGTLQNLDKIVNLFPYTSPVRYAPMREAYFRRGLDMLKSYFNGGDYRGCHEICNKLLMKGINGRTIYAYWLLTLFPSKLTKIVRIIYKEIRLKIT